ncbi:MAG: ABC transporter permease [Saprospiraceae bacterium]|jgi:putative ABC transport system permease protein|nr:ABC transporter permease [Saprospiraceae bacterium]MBK7796422.1 ABC transporter permease [Saprospiraceae bacterium]MBL0260187.1 ABC transporter permease [Saprospiraceae bacterium]
MKALYLAWKNMLSKPLRSGFSILLVALSVGLYSIIFLIEQQLENHFSKNLAETDLVISAKGSPLQSVLCNIYHADVPTGNIHLSEVKAFFNPKHPVIQEALPLSLGDQVHSYRIVGTTTGYLDWYKLTLAEGDSFQQDFDAVIGSEVALQLGLKPGSSFEGGHGLNAEDSLESHPHHFIVKGVLMPTGQISDRLVYCPISTYWAIHDQGHHHDHEGENHDHEHHDEENRTVLSNDSLAGRDYDISALLLRFRGNNIQALNFGRMVNDNTNVMASYPAIEMNRLYELTGSASDLLKWIGLMISILAGISIFIHLWHSLQERKKETALMRLGGASKIFIFSAYLFEAVILGVFGVFLAWIFSHTFLELFSKTTLLKRSYQITGWFFHMYELRIYLFAVLICMIAALIPSYLAMRSQIQEDLTEF